MVRPSAADSGRSNKRAVLKNWLQILRLPVPEDDRSEDACPEEDAKDDDPEDDGPENVHNWI